MARTFSEYCEARSNSGPCWYEFEVDDYAVHVLLTEESGLDHFLTEADHKGKPIGGKYSARLDPPHGGQGKQHIHVFAKKKELFAMNIDGTAHDKSHKKHIPNKAADGIRTHFPGFTLPKDNLIEHAGDDAYIAYAATIIVEG